MSSVLLQLSGPDVSLRSHHNTRRNGVSESMKEGAAASVDQAVNHFRPTFTQRARLQMRIRFAEWQMG